MTDIWGLVFRPRHLDPAQKYPVIENIYAGPQGLVRPQNLRRAGLRCSRWPNWALSSCSATAWVRATAPKRSTTSAGAISRMPASRTESPGSRRWRQVPLRATRAGSASTAHQRGGQSSTGALLFHPEFLQGRRLQSCGCHDNRIDKQWWNEQWMGYPVGPWYADNSNITHAANLRGKLLLLVGELDTNVPPESTLRLTDALIKAGKDFDLLIITGSDHTSGGAYGERRRRDFFIRHLLGVEPPDRNLPVPPVRPTVLTPRPLSDASEAQAVGGDETTRRVP